jgi:cytochrome b561
MQQPTGYGNATIRFHWVTAIAIITMWPIGKIMVGGKPPSQFLYSVHAGLGLVVASVTLVRVFWVLRTERPEQLEMPRLEKTLFVANHYVLYGLLGVLSLTGIVMLFAAGSFDAIALAKNDGPSQQHEIAALVFLLMFVMHVAGVVYYQVKKGKTLQRMGVPLR